MTGCTQTATTPAAAQPTATIQGTTEGTAQGTTQTTAQAQVVAQTTVQRSELSDEANYQAAAAKIVSEYNVVLDSMGAASSKLDAIKTPDQLPGALASVSDDLNTAVVHVQTAQDLAGDLTNYSTTAQQELESGKILTNLGYLENALAALNDAVSEARKPSPDIALMDAKLKESDDWLARMV